MSIPAIIWAYEQEQLPAPQKAVLLSLAYHASQDGTHAFPSIALIVRECGFGRRTVIASLNKLREANLISAPKTLGRGNSSRFSLNIKGAPAAPIEKEKVHLVPVKGAGDAPQPSLEPSVTNVNKENTKRKKSPVWLKTLELDPRWPEEDLNGFVERIETAYPDRDLAQEAVGCYEWLQSPKGLRKKRLMAVWGNWLKNSIRFERRDNSKDTPQPLSLADEQQSYLDAKAADTQSYIDARDAHEARGKRVGPAGRKANG